MRYVLLRQYLGEPQPIDGADLEARWAGDVDHMAFVLGDPTAPPTSGRATTRVLIPWPRTNDGLAAFSASAAAWPIVVLASGRLSPALRYAAQLEGTCLRRRVCERLRNAVRSIACDIDPHGASVEHPASSFIDVDGAHIILVLRGVRVEGTLTFERSLRRLRWRDVLEPEELCQALGHLRSAGVAEQESDIGDEAVFASVVAGVGTHPDAPLDAIVASADTMIRKTVRFPPGALSVRDPGWRSAIGVGQLEREQRVGAGGCTLEELWRAPADPAEPRVRVTTHFVVPVKATESVGPGCAYARSFSRVLADLGARLVTTGEAEWRDALNLAGASSEVIDRGTRLIRAVASLLAEGRLSTIEILEGTWATIEMAQNLPELSDGEVREGSATLDDVARLIRHLEMEISILHRRGGTLTSPVPLMHDWQPTAGLARDGVYGLAAELMSRWFSAPLPLILLDSETGATHSQWPAMRGPIVVWAGMRALYHGPLLIEHELAHLALRAHPNARRLDTALRSLGPAFSDVHAPNAVHDSRPLFAAMAEEAACDLLALRARSMGSLGVEAAVQHVAEAVAIEQRARFGTRVPDSALRGLLLRLFVLADAMEAPPIARVSVDAFRPRVKALCALAARTVGAVPAGRARRICDEYLADWIADDVWWAEPTVVEVRSALRSLWTDPLLGVEPTPRPPIAPELASDPQTRLLDLAAAAIDHRRTRLGTLRRR